MTGAGIRRLGALVAIIIGSVGAFPATAGIDTQPPPGEMPPGRDIASGQSATVQTVVVYLDGCPLVRIVPPDGGRGKPRVENAPDRMECVSVEGSVAGADRIVGEGMYVQVAREAPSGTDAPAPQTRLEQIATEAASSVEVNDDLSPGGRSLVVDIINMYPDADAPADDRPSDRVAGGPTEPFDIPGIYGNESGTLNPDRLMPVGSGGGGSLGFGGGGGPGGGGDRSKRQLATMLTSGDGSGGRGAPGGGLGTPTGGGASPSGGPSSSGGGGSYIQTVPLPATLVLLLGALMVLRTYVRKA